MQRELELKLELTRADAARLRATLPAELQASPGKTARLRTIYFDTPDHELHAAGLSLRLQQQEGRWLQTVKAEQHVDAGLSNPVELEASIQGDSPQLDKIPHKKIKRRVEKIVKGAALHSVFETVVQRTVRRITATGSEIELAVDDGELVAGSRSTRLVSKVLREHSAEAGPKAVTPNRGVIAMVFLWPNSGLNSRFWNG